MNSLVKQFGHKVVFFIIVTLCVSLFPYMVFGQSTLSNISFYSNSLAENKNVQIYLPEGYNSQESIRYSVIYFLHGATDNHTSNAELKGILDNLISDSSISPIIVVKPDGSIGPWAGSVYTNSELYGDFEDYIVYDLVEYIDSNYNTIPNKEKRAIMGHSMGAYGSMKLALKYPEIFCGVAAHSGPLDFNKWTLWVDLIISENGGVPPYTYVSNINRIFTYFFYTAAGAFSPNLNKSPYQVDFPLDSLGNFIDSTFKKWFLHDPVELASNLNTNLSIYFDCGMQDELLFYEFNSSFAESLDVFGLDYVFNSYTGNHGNQIENRFPIALTYLDSILGDISTTVRKNKNSLPTILLSQNYPNPFNPSTKIKYSIPQKSNVSLKVFDVLGGEVATLVYKEQSQGNYEVEFDGSDLTSGIYFFRLSAGDFVKTKKMILLK